MGIAGRERDCVRGCVPASLGGGTGGERRLRSGSSIGEDPPDSVRWNRRELTDDDLVAELHVPANDGPTPVAGDAAPGGSGGVGRSKSLSDGRGWDTWDCWVGMSGIESDGSLFLPRNRFRRAPELFLSERPGGLRPSAAGAGPLPRLFCAAALASLGSPPPFLLPKPSSSVDGRRSKSIDRRVLSGGGGGAGRLTLSGCLEPPVASTSDGRAP